MHILTSTPRLLAVLGLALASILAAATPLPAPDSSAIGNGSSGLCGGAVAALLCCHTVEPATSPAARTLLAAVGAAVQDAATPVGIACAPIAAGGACSANAVCCAGEFGLLGVGCLPALM